MFLSALGFVIVLIWAYILFIREWLVVKWPNTFKWWHEQVEDRLWDKSRTMLVSRGYWIGGIIISFHEFLAASGYDVTPLLQQITDLLPVSYRQYAPLMIGVFLMLTGWGFAWLRKQTTTALSEKE